MNGICETGGLKQLKAMPRRTPIDGTFELTVRCNLHCKMCLFRHKDEENATLCRKELTAEQWIDLAGQVAEAGTMSLLLTGGEPTLRPDFCRIYEGIYQQGFLLTLYTNATLITPQVMETLRRYPPHRIGVTIYGASPETYQATCGDGKAFQRMLEGVRQLQTLPSLMEFRTTLIKDNVQDAVAIEELVHREFGQDYLVTQTRMVVKAVRGGCAEVDSCRLDPEENVRLAFRRGIAYIKEQVGDSFDEKKLVLEYQKQSGDSVATPQISLFGCSAGMSSYAISWDGKLMGCQMTDLFAVDTREQGFQSAWDKFPRQVKIMPLQEECKTCPSLELCSCCIATRYAETGDMGGKPDYVCADTKIIQGMLDAGKTENGGAGSEVRSRDDNNWLNDGHGGNSDEQSTL